MSVGQEVLVWCISGLSSFYLYQMCILLCISFKTSCQGTPILLRMHGLLQIARPHQVQFENHRWDTSVLLGENERAVRYQLGLLFQGCSCSNVTARSTQ